MEDLFQEAPKCTCIDLHCCSGSPIEGDASLLDLLRANRECGGDGQQVC
jgi:hypothetical protein